MLKKRPVVLLDEAAAALDEKTESLIHQTIHNQFRNCTVICISHRLTHAPLYNRIVVFDGGKIVECGTYGELTSSRGYFNQLGKSSAEHSK